jgi:hypothetical protein
MAPQDSEAFDFGDYARLVDLRGTSLSTELKVLHPTLVGRVGTVLQHVQDGLAFLHRVDAAIQAARKALDDLEELDAAFGVSEPEACLRAPSSEPDVTPPELARPSSPAPPPTASTPEVVSDRAWMDPRTAPSAARMRGIGLTYAEADEIRMRLLRATAVGPECYAETMSAIALERSWPKVRVSCHRSCVRRRPETFVRGILFRTADADRDALAAELSIHLAVDAVSMLVSLRNGESKTVASVAPEDAGTSGTVPLPAAASPPTRTGAPWLGAPQLAPASAMLRRTPITYAEADAIRLQLLRADTAGPEMRHSTMMELAVKHGWSKAKVAGHLAIVRRYPETFVQGVLFRTPDADRNALAEELASLLVLDARVLLASVRSVASTKHATGSSDPPATPVVPPRTGEESEATEQGPLSTADRDALRLRLLRARARVGDAFAIERAQIMEQHGLGSKHIASLLAHASGKSSQSFANRVLRTTPTDVRVDVAEELADLCGLDQDDLLAAVEA